VKSSLVGLSSWCPPWVRVCDTGEEGRAAATVTRQGEPATRERSEWSGQPIERRCFLAHHSDLSSPCCGDGRTSEALQGRVNVFGTIPYHMHARIDAAQHVWSKGLWCTGRAPGELRMKKRSGRVFAVLLALLIFTEAESAFAQSPPDPMEILEIQVGPKVFYVQRAWMDLRRQRKDGSVIPYEEIEGQRCIAVTLQPNRPDLPEQQQKWVAIAGVIHVNSIQVCPDGRLYKKSFEETYPKENWPLFPETMIGQTETPYCLSNHTPKDTLKDRTSPLYCRVYRRAGDGIYITYQWNEALVAPADWLKLDIQVQTVLDWLMAKPGERPPTVLN
jgi:hypothetical protein